MTEVVVGGSGLLGSHLLELRPHAVGTFRHHPRPGLVPLDMADAGAVRSLLGRGTVQRVIVAANPRSLDWCERHAEDSHREQVQAVQVFMRILDEVAPESTLVFLSTDYVFDGRVGGYDEDDAAAPLQTYGRHKLAAEEVVRRSGHPAWIVRTSLLYGENRWQPEAPASFPLQVVKSARTGERVVASDNLLSSPTEVRSLATLLWRLTELPPAGLIHAVGGPSVTRLAFARAALRTWGLEEWPGLERISADGDGRLPGQTMVRPRDSSLATRRLQALYGALPALSEGLLVVRRRVETALDQR